MISSTPKFLTASTLVAYRQAIAAWPAHGAKTLDFRPVTGTLRMSAMARPRAFLSFYAASQADCTNGQSQNVKRGGKNGFGDAVSVVVSLDSSRFWKTKRKIVATPFPRILKAI
jgi:hypothetical protein